jgi:hypothetical protein
MRVKPRSRSRLEPKICRFQHDLYTDEFNPYTECTSHRVSRANEIGTPRLADCGIPTVSAEFIRWQAQNPTLIAADIAFRDKAQKSLLTAIGLIVACTAVKPTIPPAIVVKNTSARKIRRRNFVSAFAVEFTISPFITNTLPLRIH